MLPKPKGDIFMRVLNMDIYLANLSKRYRKANKHEKGIILNELCEMSGFHKKHAIRLLNTPKKKQKPRINIGRPFLSADLTQASRPLF